MEGVRQIQNHAIASAFVGDGGDGGNFKVLWVVMLCVVPLDEFGVALCDFLHCFFMKGGGGVGMFGGRVGSLIDGFLDGSQGPWLATIRWASLGGTLFEERSGRMRKGAASRAH